MPALALLLLKRGPRSRFRPAGRGARAAQPATKDEVVVADGAGTQTQPESAARGANSTPPAQAQMPPGRPPLGCRAGPLRPEPKGPSTAHHSGLQRASSRPRPAKIIGALKRGNCLTGPGPGTKPHLPDWIGQEALGLHHYLGRLPFVGGSTSTQALALEGHSRQGLFVPPKSGADSLTLMKVAPALWLVQERDPRQCDQKRPPL
jgi:hypothetical protein